MANQHNLLTRFLFNIQIPTKSVQRRVLAIQLFASAELFPQELTPIFLD